VNNYISESTVAGTLAPYYQYENTIVKQAAWIWTPTPDNVFATATNLAGYGLTSEFCGAFNYIEPQFWYFTK
jgi:hypothetical protein